MEPLKTYRIFWVILRGLAAFPFPFPLSLGFAILDRVDARPLSSRIDDSCKIKSERQSLVKGGQSSFSHLLPRVSAARNEIKQPPSYLEFPSSLNSQFFAKAKNN
jgi:hypothetical protein